MKFKLLKQLVLFICVICLGVVTFSSCSDDDDNIVIEQPTLTFKGVTGGEFQTTKVITDKEWSIREGHEDWIIPEKSEDKFIVIGVKDNPNATSREGKVVLVSGNATATVHVKQDGKETEE